MEKKKKKKRRKESERNSLESSLLAAYGDIVGALTVRRKRNSPISPIFQQRPPVVEFAEVRSLSKLDNSASIRTRTRRNDVRVANEGEHEGIPMPLLSLSGYCFY